MDKDVKYEFIGYSELQPFITGKTKSLDGVRAERMNLLLLEHDSGVELFSLSEGYLTNCQYQSIDIICNGYFIVQLNEKYGIISDRGEEVLAPEYAELRYYGGHIVICRKDNMYGSFNFILKELELGMRFIDIVVISNGTNSSDVIYAAGTDINYSSDNEAKNQEYTIKKEHYTLNYEVKEKNYYRIINSHEDYLFSSWEYIKLYPFHISPTYNNDNEVDKWHHSVLKYLPIFYSINRILCGNDEDKFGFFDAEKSFMVVPFRYEQILYRDEGYLDICKDKKWGIMDLKTCREIVPCKYDKQIPHFLDTFVYVINGIEMHIVELINGKRICIVEENEHYGCIDDLYNEIIPTVYHHIMFERENRYIFCGFRGRYKDEENPFSGYLWDTTWGCFDHTGKCIVPVEFDYIKIIENYISAGKGYWMLEGQFEYMHCHEDDFNGNCMLFSPEGNIIVQDYYNEIEISIDTIKVRRDIKYECHHGEYHYQYYSKTGGYYSIYNKEGVLLEENIIVEEENIYQHDNADNNRYDGDDDWRRDSWDALTDGQYGDFSDSGYDLDRLLDSMGRN